MVHISSRPILFNGFTSGSHRPAHPELPLRHLSRGSAVHAKGQRADTNSPRTGPTVGTNMVSARRRFVRGKNASPSSCFDINILTRGQLSEKDRFSIKHFSMYSDLDNAVMSNPRLFEITVVSSNFPVVLLERPSFSKLHRTLLFVKDTKTSPMMLGIALRKSFMTQRAVQGRPTFVRTPESGCDDPLANV